MPPSLPLVPTGVPGLDTLLGGGLPLGSLTMLMGRPGTGKTTLAQQLCFGWVARQRATQADPAVANRSKALYFSLLSEPHDKLIAHMRTFTFFDADALGTTLNLLSLSGLVAQGPAHITKIILETCRREKAGFVVIDGVDGLATTSEDLLRFLYDLSAQLGVLGTTVVVGLQTAQTPSLNDRFLTAADGVVHLQSHFVGVREYRQVSVLKMRGVNRLLGWHSYAINAEGVSIYPRLESVVPTSLTFPAPDRTNRFRLNLPELDTMLGGGLPQGTATVIAGSLGSGKTIFALHFLLAAVLSGQRCLYVGFHESEAELVAKAARFGLDLRTAVAEGRVRLFLVTPVEQEADMLAAQIRTIIEAQAMGVLVIDSYALFEQTTRMGERSLVFAGALVTWLRQKGVTTVVTHEIRKVVGPELDLSETALAALSDNVILLRHVEYKAALYRVVSVLKMRDSTFDPSLREFVIADAQGLSVRSPLESAEGMLTGIARRDSAAGERA